VRRVGFSPSGELVVTASDDGTARVWEVGGGRSVALLSGYRGAVAAAAFSPDGRRIVTAGDDGAARLYACDVCEPIDALVRDAQTAAMRDPAAREKQRFVRP
jgi:WD40 repeat protein